MVLPVIPVALSGLFLLHFAVLAGRKKTLARPLRTRPPSPSKRQNKKVTENHIPQSLWASKALFWGNMARLLGHASPKTGVSWDWPVWPMWPFAFALEHLIN